MRLALKMGASLVLLVVIALGLVDVLNYYKYKTLLGTLVRSRMEVATDDLQNGIQTALRLGLSLDDMRTANDLIARAKAQDPLIVSIAVFEASRGGGQILYDTDQGAVSGSVSPDWISTAFAPGNADATWQVSEDNGAVVGATLVDRLEQPIGGLVLRYSTGYEDRQLEAMSNRLILSAGEALGVTVVIDMVVLAFLFRPVLVRFRAMDVQLQASAGGTIPSEVDPAFAAFGERVRAATRAMDAMEEALDRDGRGEGPSA